MKRRLVSLVLTMAMVGGLVAGCGSKGNETSYAEDGSMELTIWVHETDSDEGKLYAQLIEEFNEEYAGTYHATLTQIARSGDAGGYDDKVNAAISNDGLPDVFTVDGVTVAEYADAGAIVPIGEYFTDEELADFNDDIIEQGTYEGELYTLGAMDSSVGIYYNKTLFEEAGITPATVDDPWTLEELTAACAALTTEDRYGITMSLDSKDETLIYFFLPLIYSQGSNVIADDGVTVDGYLNGEAAVNVLTWLKEMVDNGYASATPSENSLEQGEAAMALSGAWEASTLEEYDMEWGLMPMPIYEEGDEAVSACGSWTFAMSSDCTDDRKEGAAELIKFMTSTDACARMYDANSMPPARSSAFDEISDFSTEPLSVLSYQLQNTSQARPVSVNYSILSDQFATAVQNVLTGMDVEEALEEAVTQYNFQADVE